MPVNTALKTLVRKTSTRRSLRGLRESINRLIGELIKELMHGRALANLCRGKTELLLNIGCGDLLRQGWINVDLHPRPGALYFNALDPLPIASETVARIHMEHFLEHFDFSDGYRLLAECHRVLQPNGMVRLIVPDAERYIRAYVDDDASFFHALRDLGGPSEPLATKAAVCNQMFRMGGDHRFAWDFETINHVGSQIGFSVIRRSLHNDVAVSECIDGQDWWRPVESLYVNLTR